MTQIRLRVRDVTGPIGRGGSQHESILETLGRLSAALAHEINSPMQFVGDNARFLAEACQYLLRIVHSYRELLTSTHRIGWEDRRSRMRAAEEDLELDYLEGEIPGAVEHMLEGIERVATVVRALRRFSHPGHDEQVAANLNGALEAPVTGPQHEPRLTGERAEELHRLAGMGSRRAGRASYGDTLSPDLHRSSPPASR